MTGLTNAQLLLFKSWITTNNAGVFDQTAVTALNTAAAGPYVVWRDLSMTTVVNLITFANMTPLDAVPTTPDLAIQLWIARSLSCQGKQFNLQNLINGRTLAPMKTTSYRSALQDCLTNLPSGASGALLAANWAGVRDAAKYNATNAEKLLATGTGTTATPADLAANGEGDVTITNVVDAQNAQ